jgi:hypothetical protein
MATLAVFIALGGGAWAVAIGRNDVGSREIGRNAVGSPELKNDKAKGADIDEGSLGQVPSAAFAESAGTANSANTANSATTAESANTAASATEINGLSVVPINSRQPTNTATQTILDLAGLQLKASCAPGLNVTAETTKPGSSIFMRGTDTDTNAPEDDFGFDLENQAFSPGTPVDVDQQLGGNGDFPILGSIAYENPDGSQVTVDFVMDAVNVGGVHCLVTGNAIGA